MGKIYRESRGYPSYTGKQRDLSETIERIFGTAKEHHGFRYTQYIGKARMEMKAELTFACMNLKKLAKILVMRNRKSLSFIYRIEFLLNKINARDKWCLA